MCQTKSKKNISFEPAKCSRGNPASRSPRSKNIGAAQGQAQTQTVKSAIVPFRAEAGKVPVEELLDRALASMEHLREAVDTMTRLLDELLGPRTETS